MARRRNLGLTILAALLTAACGQQGSDTPDASAGEPVEAVPIAGMYQVSGATVAVANGQKREISGTVILAENGDSYTATYELRTTYPGEDQMLPADVIGKGEGKINGRTLEGTADTQLVMATVPGVDPGFAYIPRTVSTRITSSSIATVAADGSVSIEIENAGAPGVDYDDTRTTLRGRKVSAAGIGGGSVDE